MRSAVLETIDMWASNSDCASWFNGSILTVNWNSVKLFTGTYFEIRNGVLMSRKYQSLAGQLSNYLHHNVKHLLSSSFEKSTTTTQK